jgi:hypothetical protein
LDWRERILHGVNGLTLLMTGLGVLGLPLGAALLASMIAHGEAPAVSPNSWCRWPPRHCWPCSPNAHDEPRLFQTHHRPVVAM